MKRIQTIGELRNAIVNCPDDQPCYICVDGPRSENPCSFEDEYGPGASEHIIYVNTDNNATSAVLLHLGEENSYPVSI